ncbi:MAG: hypothetical protein ACRENE_29340 [Polyangiaceae bacterium]
MKRRALLALLGMVGVAAALGGTARADGPLEQRAHVQISVIHALKSDGGASIDPRLRDLPQLTRDQPFVRYNVYKLLDRKEMPISVGPPVPYSLANGRAMQVRLTQVGVEGGATRYHVRVEIDEPGKQPVAVEVTAGPKEPFFVAGHNYEGGTLFIEFVMQGS